jgi:hypothetical protein
VKRAKTEERIEFTEVVLLDIGGSTPHRAIYSFVKTHRNPIDENS